MGRKTCNSFIHSYATHVAHDVLSQKTGSWYAPAFHFSRYMAGDVHSNLVRFRMGNHDLLTERRRWLREDQRDAFDCSCTFCVSGEIEDESHFWFRCVRYENMRMDDDYNDVFELANASVRAIFSYSDQVKLAKLISEMLRVRR